MRKLVLLVASLFLAASANGAVAFDAKMAGGNGVGATYAEITVAGTTLSTAGMTVGGSATLLVVPVSWGTSGAVTSPTATWNGASMTLGPLVGGTASAAIFYLPNPATGNKTLVVSWTGSNIAYVTAISFTGTDTVTGVKVSDNTSTAAANSLTVTSDAAGASVVAYTNSGATASVATTFTAIFAGSDWAPNGAASYAIGGTSNVHSFTADPGTRALAGVHVIAPGGGGGTPNAIIGGKAILGGKVVVN